MGRQGLDLANSLSDVRCSVDCHGDLFIRLNLGA